MGRNDRIKRRTTKAKRKRFYGNQFTNKNGNVSDVLNDGVAEKEQNCAEPLEKRTPSISQGDTCISAMKIKIIETHTPKSTGPTITGYRFIDVELLGDVFAVLGCPECEAIGLRLHENFSEKKGMLSLLTINCLKCNFKTDFLTSKKCGKSYDINRRIIYSMRTIGQGYAALESFSGNMNLPRPMTQKSFDKSVKVFTKVVQDIAEESMKEAADELRGQSDDNTIKDVSVTADGSWQRRGYSSLNGTFTALSLDTGKVLDIEVMSRSCKECKIKQPLKKSDFNANEIWRANHDCKANHSGSAGSMEITGATRIFGRSIKKRGLRYSKYLGDGDSKAYDSVKSTYPGIEVAKLECVGPKARWKTIEKSQKEVKKLGGRRRLTNNTIDKLQKYFGIAVRSNVGDAENMMSGIYASLFHVASSKTSDYHTHCPSGESSWCRYKADKETGLSTYEPGPGLPLDVIKHIKPIYSELSQDDLLKKCTHGKTQNQNEAFNNLIWERLPKHTYVSLTPLHFGTYDAVAHFNMGKKSTVLIYKKLGMIPGRYTIKQCNSTNRKRLYFGNYKSSEKAQKRRKIIRGKKKAAMDKNEEIEGTVYEPGGFQFISSNILL